MTAVAVTTIIFTVFITGVAAGVIGVITVAVHRTERNHALTLPSADPITQTGRWLNGVYVRTKAMAHDEAASQSHTSPSRPQNACADVGPVQTSP